MAGNENNSYSKDDLDIFIFTKTLIAVLFSIGLYLQNKIIILSKKEKDVTWRIDVWHSVVMIAFFSFRILMEILTYIIPSLHQYTGKWFCYLAWFVQVYGFTSIASHSLVISIYKYFLTVHQDRIRVIGKDEASIITLWINIIFPATIAAAFVARPNGPPFPSSITSCLKKDVEESLFSKSNERLGTRLQRFFFCGFDHYDDDDPYGDFGHVMNVTNILGCFVTSIIFLVVVSNIMELFVYRKIFSFMKR